MPRNLQPGMDDDQRNKDKDGFRTTTEHVEGGIHEGMFGEEKYGVGGPQVENPYDHDPMGEERDDQITHGQGTMKGSVGRPIANDAVGKR